MTTTKSNKTVAQKQAAMTKKREVRNLTAVFIAAGIIMVLDEQGKTLYFRQRGITNISEADRMKLISLGLLNKDWEMYKELPKNIKIAYEDEFILGKARATFPKKVLDIIK